MNRNCIKRTTCWNHVLVSSGAILILVFIPVFFGCDPRWPEEPGDHLLCSFISAQRVAIKDSGDHIWRTARRVRRRQSSVAALLGGIWKWMERDVLDWFGTRRHRGPKHHGGRGYGRDWNPIAFRADVFDLPAKRKRGPQDRDHRELGERREHERRKSERRGEPSCARQISRVFCRWNYARRICEDN